MKTRTDWSSEFAGFLLLAFITGCTTAVQVAPTNEPTATAVQETPTTEPTATATPEPPAAPKPTTCDEVEGICMELTFNSESCLYDGPENIITEPVTLIFFNFSDGVAAANLIRLLEDHTYQDLIDYSGEEPFTKHHPSWSVEVSGVWNRVEAGDRHIWNGVLEPGIHALVCAKTAPLSGWLGGGFTVE